MDWDSLDIGQSENSPTNQTGDLPHKATHHEKDKHKREKHSGKNGKWKISILQKKTKYRHKEKKLTFELVNHFKAIVFIVSLRCRMYLKQIPNCYIVNIFKAVLFV